MTSLMSVSAPTLLSSSSAMTISEMPMIGKILIRPVRLIS